MIALAWALALAAPATPAPARSETPPAVPAGPAIPDPPRPRQPAGQVLPLAPARTLRATVDRGTWLSLDRTPDGTAILFDLLGDLYRLPAGGGRAVPLTRGLAFDTQPTVSPDGRLVAFVSDRSGADNLWLMRPDGGGLRQLSFGADDSVLASPAWDAGGQALFVSRYRADLNNYELWRYGLDGRETLVVPIRDRRDAPRATWRSTLGAVASPDGRSLFFARRVGGLDFDELDEWTIVRRDLATGAETTVVATPDGPRKAGNPGTCFRPALSPDGRRLAYACRLDNATELRLRDLATGADRRLAFPVEHDQAQASMWQDLLPRYAFTADGGAILLAAGGRIRRIDLAGGAASPVPFTAPLAVALGPSTRQDIREEDGPVRARLIMAPVVSPDRRRLAFSALGRLWLMPLGGGPARPFAAAGDPAFQPSWSADGRWLTWVTWRERGGGAVWLAPVDGSAAPRRISDAPAFYTYPGFAPDGRTVLAVRSPQADRLALYMEYGRTRPAELVALPRAGGAARVVTAGTIGGRPQFVRGAPDAVFLLADDGLDRIDLRTGARRLAALVKGPGWYFQEGAVPVDDVRISPDGHWLLAQVAQQLHLVAAPAASGTVDLTDPRGAHRRIDHGGMDYFEWSADGGTIDWSVGSTLHSRPFAPAGPDVAAPERTVRADVVVPRGAVATGALLLHDARALTMAAGDRVIAHADILVQNGRIAAIGPAGTLAVPPGTPVRDLGGRTVLPGFIDTHDHIATVRRDVLGLEEWGLRARLAWGVTTSFDPSTLTIDMLAYQDLLDAGLMTGPRLRQTGIALFSNQGFASLDAVRAVIRRYRDDYGLRNIKEYRTGDRRVRQWVAIACRELGMNPTTEGALAMKLDLSQILDGYAGNEHALVAAPLGDDVLALLAAQRTSYTATLEITNGGPPGQDWSIDADDPHDDPKLARFWPHAAIDQMMLRRPWHRLVEYRFPAIAADVARLQVAGGLAGIGSHGEAPGIGFHYEMEAHALGGMAPMAVLHAATIGSAETIGRAHELGSLVPGKLADLVVLDADPLVDVRNARLVREVMRDGRLFDAATLAQLWPDRTSPPNAWFAGDLPLHPTPGVLP